MPKMAVIKPDARRRRRRGHMRAGISTVRAALMRMTAIFEFMQRSGHYVSFLMEQPLWIRSELPGRDSGPMHHAKEGKGE